MYTVRQVRHHLPEHADQLKCSYDGRCLNPVRKTSTAAEASKMVAVARWLEPLTLAERVPISNTAYAKVKACGKGGHSASVGS